MWSSLFLFLKKGDLQDEATGEKERPVSVQDMSLARIGEL